MAFPLFVYGTLRDPDLLAAVLARPLRGEALVPAAAPGHRAVPYPGRLYPALVRAPGEAAPGLLLIDLTAFERDLLDAFEGPEYRRGIVAVMAGEELHEAEAYLPSIAISAAAPAWSLKLWQTNHKPDVILAEAATAAELRARLIAARPN